MWYEKQEIIKGYEALPGIPRTAPGNDCRQRPKESDVPALSAEDYQEDGIYHQNKVARIWTECIRPHVKHSSVTPWNGFDYVALRYCGLARSIQSRLYLHSCTLRYCFPGGLVARRRSKDGAGFSTSPCNHPRFEESRDMQVPARLSYGNVVLFRRCTTKV